MFEADSGTTSIFQSVKKDGFRLLHSNLPPILDHAEVKIITKPYWNSENYNARAAFALYPNYSCKMCRNGSFYCSSRRRYIYHLIDCMAKRKIIRRLSTIDTYERHGILPKSVLNALHQAEIARDSGAVCIAPVFDHYDVVRLAAEQKKTMRERQSEDMNGEMNGLDEERRKSIDSIRQCVLPQGESMPLDRRVWIETPLSSDLATMFLHGLKARRHSDTRIHFPLYDPKTGDEHASHLDIRQLKNPIHFPNATTSRVNDELRDAGALNPRVLRGSATVPVRFDSFATNELAMITRQVREPGRRFSIMEPLQRLRHLRSPPTQSLFESEIVQNPWKSPVGVGTSAGAPGPSNSIGHLEYGTSSE